METTIKYSDPEVGLRRAVLACFELPSVKPQVNSSDKQTPVWGGSVSDVDTARHESERVMHTLLTDQQIKRTGMPVGVTARLLINGRNRGIPPQGRPKWKQ